MNPLTAKQYGKVGVVVLASWYFLYYATHAQGTYFLDSVNLVIHEAGHVLFNPFGLFLTILGGSLLQVVVPIVFSVYFFLHQQRFAGSLLLFWIGQNLINVSVYAGDAVRMELPLLGGDPNGHDWHNLLAMTNTLSRTQEIAGSIYGLGFVCILLAIALSLYYALGRADITRS